MKIVTPENEVEYADRMIAIALEGRLSVFYCDDERETARFRVMLEKHMDSIRQHLPETELYYANERYVVDNRGRKGYVLLANTREQIQGLQVTEAFALHGTDDATCEILSTRENADAVGGTYDKNLRW